MDTLESTQARIAFLKEFKARLLAWDDRHDDTTREWLNHNVVKAKQEVLEAGCLRTLTISPPPAVGGLILREVDPFEMMFERVYLMSLVPIVCDMLDKTVGVLMLPPRTNVPEPRIEVEVERGYAFVAMAMDKDDANLVDVLDAIKEAAQKCSINAERIDEVESNERITDRILESIRRAEFVIVDLTKERPNVFYEAGFAHGIGKTPVYVAREGTKLHFDIKDYPVIFFRNLKELKEGVSKRLVALSQSRERESKGTPR